MHVLIPLFFKASHGGLHENILATARFLTAGCYKVTIVCPAGPFADSLVRYDIDVIQTDYSDHGSTIADVLKIHATHPIDLVHAHPFASRKFGLALADLLDIPFILTFHGKYTDDLTQYIDKAAAVLTVSPGIRDFILSEKSEAPEKFHVVPNVPDIEIFKPVFDKPKSFDKKLKVSLVSRLDNDKEFILDVFADAVKYASTHYSGEVAWVIVGDGSQLVEFRSRLDALRGDNTIDFQGWLEGEALRDAYQSSDFVFAPGRCALEAMSCGVPTIAVGSKSYCGLVHSGTWQHGVYSNFGGVGNLHKDYKPEMLHRDIDKLLASESYRIGLGALGVQIIQQFFDSQQVHEQLIGIYRLAIVSHSLNRGLSSTGNSDVANGLVIPGIKKTDMMPENNIKQLEEKLLQAANDSAGKTTRDLLIVQNRLYAQLESLSWLQRRLTIKWPLPPLRGWAASPDVLSHLHAHITATRPGVIVEFGSGASTLVIADALRQNGVGKLISIEHSDHYGAQTRANIQTEELEDWVDLRIGELEPWEGDHLNPENAEKPSRWYPVSLLDGIENVDLLWVDGPPADTCLFSRYPALPALADKLSPQVEVWLDDTIRQEERDICARWKQDHDLQLDYYPYEKGLGRLRRNDGKAAMPQAAAAHSNPIWIDHDQLIQIHQDERVILEYGSAYGRDIASTASDRFVICVESDRSTARALGRQQSSLKSPAVIFHAELSQDKPSNTGQQDTSPYLTEIWDQPFFRDPHVIIITGHLRATCLATIRQRIRKPTRVLFENYADCAESRAIENVLKPVRMIGLWAEFALKPSDNPGADLDFLVS